MMTSVFGNGLWSLLSRYAGDGGGYHPMQNLYSAPRNSRSFCMLLTKQWGGIDWEQVVTGVSTLRPRNGSHFVVSKSALGVIDISINALGLLGMLMGACVLLRGDK